MKSKSKSNETAVREVLKQWAAATREDRKDHVLRGHDRNALIFDVLAPLQYKGTAAYRKSWGDWQPTFELPSLYELKELRVLAGTELAFAHCLIRCGGKPLKGKFFEDLVRATFCLKKKAGKWLIVHQHISMPIVKKK